MQRDNATEQQVRARILAQLDDEENEVGQIYGFE